MPGSNARQGTAASKAAEIIQAGVARRLTAVPERRTRELPDR